MKVKFAEQIGFCFGVRRAVNIAEAALGKTGKFFCLGPLIHNPQEVRRLSEKGLKIVGNIKDLKKGSTLIIRSHGLLPGLIESAKGRGIKLIDATCPFVKKAQELCRMLNKEGFQVVVIGEKKHPEVKALVGFAGGSAVVVENIRDLSKLRFRNKKIGIVAQTTQSRQNFQYLVNALFKKYNDRSGLDELRIFNTICADSATRQANAKKISSVCDAILVIGGRNSANSRRLAKICKDAVGKTYHIEAADNIKPDWFKAVDRIGIVSGASTPDWIILGVVKRLKAMNKNSAKEGGRKG